MIALCVLDPDLGTMVFWCGLIAYLPLLFLVAPGLWRNICPMATLNGLPRRLGWAGKRRLSAAAQRRTPYMVVALFFLLVPLREVGLDRGGYALALFLLLFLGAPLLGGLLFAGKGGWCSQFCPMLPVERLYGISPMLVVRDTHCNSCVGCVRNCYDLQPAIAGSAELRDRRAPGSRARILFASAIPWFCLAFFTQPHVQHLTLVAVLTVYGRMALLTAAGATVGLVIDTGGSWSRYQIVVVHAAAAITIYYLFVVQSTLATLGIQTLWLGLPAHAIPVLIALVWLRRALVREASANRPRVPVATRPIWAA